MSGRVDLTVPYGVTSRGFHRKNIFADERRLLGPATRVVVDVGAHHGEEIATYLEMFPEATVHAIEPTPESLEVLHRTYGATSRVKIHAGGLAEAASVSMLHTYAASECNSLTPYAPDPLLNRASLGESQRVAVQTWTLDQFCADQGLDEIDLLKLDTQGAELRVLSGGANFLKNQRVRLLALEVLFVPLYEQQADADQVLATLRQFQYRPYDWYNFSYDDSGQVLFGDAMFLPAQRGVPQLLSALDQPASDADRGRAESEVGKLRAENERLRADVAHLEGRIERYRSKNEDLRRRLKQPSE